MGVPFIGCSKDQAIAQPLGLAIGITRELAAGIDIHDIKTLEFATPPLVIEAVKADECDLDSC